jgi:hypothetical protein
MKTVLTVCFIFIASLARADEKEIHAHRAPTVKFLYNGITVYTDTGSLFHVLSGENIRYYNQRGKDLVLRRLQQSKNDTATFIGESIPYNDSIHSAFSDYFHDWYPESYLLQLLKERRGTFIDAK